MTDTQIDRVDQKREETQLQIHIPIGLLPQTSQKTHSTESNTQFLSDDVWREGVCGGGFGKCVCFGFFRHTKYTQIS